jgi:hypothetical protein
MNRTSVFFAIVVLLISFTFFHSPGTSDVKEDLRWVTNTEKFGVRAGYIENGDSYPPLIPLFLFFVSKIATSLNLSVFIGLKLSLYLFLYLTAVIFYFATRNLWLTSAIILAFTLNSVALCYLDIFLAPTLLLSYFALAQNRLTTFAVLFAISCMIKFQPLILLPPIAIYLISRNDFKQLLVGVVLPSLLVIVIFLLVYRLELVMAFVRALFFHHQLSANATNINWILTYVLHLAQPERFGPLVDGRVDFISTTDPLLWIPSKVIFVIAYLLTLKQFTKEEKSYENLMAFSLISYFAYFTFNTGVHENHLFPAILLSFLLCWKDASFIRTSIVVSAISNLNMLLFYGINGTGLPFSRVVGIDLSVLLATITTFFCGVLWKQTLTKLRQVQSNQDRKRLLFTQPL